jgi:hypothetical protein
LGGEAGWYCADVQDQVEGWNDGQLLTPQEAISRLNSLIDPANPPDRYPVAIVLSPEAPGPAECRTREQRHRQFGDVGDRLDS